MPHLSGTEDEALEWRQDLPNLQQVSVSTFICLPEVEEQRGPGSPFAPCAGAPGLPSSLDMQSPGGRARGQRAVSRCDSLSLSEPGLQRRKARASSPLCPHCPRVRGLPVPAGRGAGWGWGRGPAPNPPGPAPNPSGPPRPPAAPGSRARGAAVGPAAAGSAPGLGGAAAAGGPGRALGSLPQGAGRGAGRFTGAAVRRGSRRKSRKVGSPRPGCLRGGGRVRATGGRRAGEGIECSRRASSAGAGGGAGGG